MRRERGAEHGGDVGAGRRWQSRWPVGSSRADDGDEAVVGRSGDESVRREDQRSVLG